MGKMGTRGHLNPRGISGCDLLRTITDIASKMKADNVPIFTSSIMSALGDIGEKCICLNVTVNLEI